MSGLQNVLADLVAEGDSVDAMVAGIDETQWSLPTPAPGWTVSDQVAHLSFVYRMAGLAATDSEMFHAVIPGAGQDFDAAVNGALAEYRHDPPEVLLARWRADRATAEKALSVLPAEKLVPWVVRPVLPEILASAGMMELVGHGQDIADALGTEREWTDRIRHVVRFAVRVWDFGYLSRGLIPPDVRFRYEVTGPSGELWCYGPEDAEQRITGTAVDLCLLVTRRRHRADLDLVAAGGDADRWLDIAQCYRGAPGAGRAPGKVR